MNIDMIRAAADRAAGHVRRTPLLNSPFLDDVAGRRVWIKAEALQHTGSFKYRGAWSAISALTDPGGIIASSSGNHAQAIARVAHLHGREAVIIMPDDAPKMKVDNTRALGAEVVFYDRMAGVDRDKMAEDMARDRNLHLIKPFDHPQVIAGQGTTGLEIADQARAEGITKGQVLVCCGGGGLTSGIALALEAEAPNFRVHPVEPEKFDDVARSLKSGQIETNAQTGGGICDAIVTPAPGQLTFPHLHRLCGPGFVIPEDDCLRAMAHAFSRLKLVLEPGGAIALAAALFHGDQIEGDDVICVASGGNVDADMFAHALKVYAQ